MLWSIIGDSGFVVSSVVPSTQALLSFHILTGKMETRPNRRILLAPPLFMHKGENNDEDLKKVVPDP